MQTPTGTLDDLYRVVLLVFQQQQAMQGQLNQLTVLLQHHIASSPRPAVPAPDVQAQNQTQTSTTPFVNAARAQNIKKKREELALEDDKRRRALAAEQLQRQKEEVRLAERRTVEEVASYAIFQTEEEQGGAFALIKESFLSEVQRIKERENTLRKQQEEDAARKAMDDEQAAEDAAAFYNRLAGLTASDDDDEASNAISDQSSAISDTAEKYLRAFFDRADTNTSGVLDINTLANVARQLHCEMSKKCAMDAMVRLLQGTSGAKVVTFELFCAWFNSSNVAEDGNWLSAMRKAISSGIMSKVREEPSGDDGDTVKPAPPAMLRAFFDRMDFDKSGTLNAKKLGSCANFLGCEMSQENAKATMETLIKETDSKVVTFEMFECWFHDDPSRDGAWLRAIRARILTS